MDTTPTKSIKYKRRGLSLLSVLGGLLLLLPLLVPPVAFASSTNPTKSLAGLSPTGIRDLAGVSVVRLEMFYVQSQTHTAVQRTALGTLIASWPATSTNDENNWVLTDGSMLATDGGRRTDETRTPRDAIASPVCSDLRGELGSSGSSRTMSTTTRGSTRSDGCSPSVPAAECCVPRARCGAAIAAC